MISKRGNTKKQSGKVVLPAKVANGDVPKASLKNKDTEYYQVAKHGDYVQEVN